MHIALRSAVNTFKFHTHKL